MNRWKSLASKIGSLRYQYSRADCVANTVVNGLLVVTGEPIDQKLLQLIWSVSIGNENGADYLGSSITADILQSWFKRSHLDGKGRRAQPCISEVIEGEAVGLHRNNALARCLNAGGVACIPTEYGTHYILVLAEEGGKYLMFDPTWPQDELPQISKSKANENLLHQCNEDYCGLVNLIWSRERFEKEFIRKSNKWMHLICKT